MKIISQSSANECGICCANMIINHFYKNDKDRKSELLNLANINQNGISIYCLEKLLNKYNIACNSYHANWNEIFNINDPMILVIRNNNEYHYVVGIMQNNELVIYDPISKITSYKISQKLNEWLGIVLICEFNKKKIKPINFSIPLYRNISFSFNLIFILFNVFEFSFSLFSSLILSKLINLDNTNLEMNLIWKFSFIYIVIIVISSLFTLFNKLIKLYYLKQIYKQTIHLFWKQILNKKNNFFNYYNKHQICQYINYVNNLINFYAFYHSEILCEIIIFSLTSIILALLNVNNIIFILIYLLLNLIIVCFKFKNNTNVIQNMTNNKPKIEEKLFNYLEYKKNNLWKFNEEQLINNIQNNINSVTFNSYYLNIKNEFINIINLIINDLLTYGIILFIITNNKSNIGLIFISINLFTMNNKNINSITNYGKEYCHSKQILKLIKIFYATDNIKTNTNSIKIKFNQFKIEYNDNLYNSNLLIDTNNLSNHELVNGLINFNNSKIKINYLSISKYSEEYLSKQIIYINKDNFIFYLNVREIIYSIDSDLQIKIFKFFHLNNINLESININELDESMKTIFILLCLLNIENKIICMNNCFKNINKDYLNLICDLVKTINKNNFLISNNVDNELENLYDYWI